MTRAGIGAGGDEHKVRSRVGSCQVLHYPPPILELPPTPSDPNPSDPNSLRALRLGAPPSSGFWQDGVSRHGAKALRGGELIRDGIGDGGDEDKVRSRVGSCQFLHYPPPILELPPTPSDPNPLRALRLGAPPSSGSWQDGVSRHGAKALRGGC